ncbi:MAG: DUF2934 domain-containing protein [Gallionellaceae bacterium]
MSTNAKTSGGKAKTDTKAPASKISDSQRRQYIEVAAYYIAESGGFKCGCNLENWLAAEAKIDQLLAEGKL